MKNILKVEEAAMFGLSIVGFTYLDFPWWLYPALLLVPDIGMIGYAVNNRVGAFTYNLVHHKGIAILFYVVGLYCKDEILQLTGLMLFGHSSMDRMFGYGLKLNDGFKKTHLGEIGK